MSKEKIDVKDLKENYEKLKKKYSLPDFEKLSREFHIEKISHTEIEFLMKEIRRFMADKIMNYLKLVETVLNPMNSSMFIFSIAKSIDNEGKKKMMEAYKKLSEINLELIILDVESSQEKEGEFIKKTYSSWQEIKKILLPILEKVKNNKDKGIKDKIKKDYFS